MQTWTSVRRSKIQGNRSIARRSEIWPARHPRPSEERSCCDLTKKASIQPPFRSVSSAEETLRSAHKKRPMEAPIVSLPKCNVCEMALIGVRG